VVKTITGAGQTAKVIGEGGKPSYSGKECSVVGASIVGTGGDNNPIAKGTSVTCKTIIKGEATFKVDSVTGIAGKKATVTGTVAGKPKSYTASDCKTVTAGAQATGTGSTPLGIDDTVSCKPTIGSPKVFTIKNIVAGKTPAAATVKGASGESYAASKCTKQTVDASAKTISAIKMQITPTDASTWPTVKSKLEAKFGKIIAVLDSKNNAVTQAGGGRGSRKQRGGKLATMTTKKTFTVVFNKASVDPAAVQNAVNSDAMLKTNIAGVDVVRTTLPAAAIETVKQARATAGASAAPAGSAAPTGSAAPAGASAAPADSEGAAPETATGSEGAATGSEGAAAPNASVPTAEGAAPPPPPPGRRAPASTGNNGLGANPLVPGNAAPGQGFVGPANVFNASKSRPDGIAFPIEPGDYKGLPSKNKYFIYYDPFFQKRAANVIIKTGTDPKVGPQYSYFRVTGTDQQILDGIRAIRGRGTGNVFDDLIKDMQQQLVEKRTDLSRQQSSLETLNESLSQVTGQAQEDVKGEIAAIRQEISATTRRISALEGSIVKFQKEKEKGVQNATTGAY
jgi:uncharacterized coiled-coil protein SlyX